MNVKPVTLPSRDPSSDRLHRQNRLLAILPQDVLTALTEQASIVPLARGRVLQEIGEPVREVLFPHSGVIALVSDMGDCRGAGTLTIGAEGYLGFWAVLGGDHRALSRADVQVPGTATRVPIDGLLALSWTYAPLRDLLLRYCKVLLKQAIQTAACNGLHPLSARCARWVLVAHDRAHGADTIDLSQAFLAITLGVRRQSIGAVAAKFQENGLLRLDHGRMTVLDRPGLEAASCSCYDTVRRIYDAIVPSVTD
ncbi:helix-turn-helix domain-containing protein [Microvirga mediterraneensis]|uniref:Crp/Fnr family transcriptional regulator n=1 Tax=Microvirga mediterraneensis TaxID=2754695 RepID=A0A838BV96_9HYPH|nr:Crp/Fnr family transcriptional regulator [Microvirga mediterraneensis]